MFLTNLWVVFYRPVHNHRREIPWILFPRNYSSESPLFWRCSLLEVKDLSSFRLVHSYLAEITFHLLVRQLGVLDTVEDLNELSSFISSKSFGGSTRSLTILYGRWPMCNLTDWVTHPLQLCELAQPSQAWKKSREDAFSRYRQFVEREARRNKEDDVRWLRKALEQLPKLQIIRIAHVHTKPGRLETNWPSEAYCSAETVVDVAIYQWVYRNRRIQCDEFITLPSFYLTFINRREVQLIYDNLSTSR